MPLRDTTWCIAITYATRMPQSKERHSPVCADARAHRGSEAKVLYYTGRRTYELKKEILTKWNKRELNTKSTCSQSQVSQHRSHSLKPQRASNFLNPCTRQYTPLFSHRNCTAWQHARQVRCLVSSYPSSLALASLSIVLRWKVFPEIQLLYG